MQELGIKPADASVKDLGIEDGKAHWNLPPQQLINFALQVRPGKADKLPEPSPSTQVNSPVDLQKTSSP